MPGVIPPTIISSNKCTLCACEMLDMIGFMRITNTQTDSVLSQVCCDGTLCALFNELWGFLPISKNYTVNHEFHEFIKQSTDSSSNIRDMSIILGGNDSDSTYINTPGKIYWCMITFNDGKYQIVNLWVNNPILSSI